MINASGSVARSMCFKKVPEQCLQRSAHSSPVTEMAGKLIPGMKQSMVLVTRFESPMWI